MSDEGPMNLHDYRMSLVGQQVCIDMGDTEPDGTPAVYKGKWVQSFGDEILLEGADGDFMVMRWRYVRRYWLAPAETIEVTSDD